MRVSEFDFELPEEAIALRPAYPRESARLLVVRPDVEPVLEDRVVADLPHLLSPGDALVFNDTKVIKARLHGYRDRNGAVAKIEIMLHQRVDERRWRAFARPAKKWLLGESVIIQNDTAELQAMLIERSPQGDVLIEFDQLGPALDMAITSLGELPLPPYIAGKRAVDERDDTDYQTIFAKSEGAVAAPTAGLHFTPSILSALAERGVSTHTLTLHVGAGTFLPVKVEDTDAHVMHAEWGQISVETADALNAIRQNGGRIIAVGTTSLRLLESASSESGDVLPFAGDTSIFLRPGSRFRCVDALITNFHLPRSTLFMLVAAFSGLDVMKNAYRHAIADGYRFYSYGDASLLYRKDAAR